MSRLYGQVPSGGNRQVDRSEAPLGRTCRAVIAQQFSIGVAA